MSPLVRDSIEKDCVCNQASYSPLVNSTTDFAITNSCNLKAANGTLYKWQGEAMESDEAKYKVYYASIPVMPYWIVYAEEYDGEYDNVIVWSCSSVFGVGSVKMVWILSRTRTMSTAKVEQLMGLVEEITGYPGAEMLLTNQSSCQ